MWYTVLQNWAQRMGNSTIQDKDQKGENISTVGVDIGDLILQRNNREIVFSTWDFGGQVSIYLTIYLALYSIADTQYLSQLRIVFTMCLQKEYYATHQYFLSKRSLYLVVWKLTDGEKGVNEIQQWLVNIQVHNLEYTTCHIHLATRGICQPVNLYSLCYRPVPPTHL